MLRIGRVLGQSIPGAMVAWTASNRESLINVFQRTIQKGNEPSDGFWMAREVGEAYFKCLEGPFEHYLIFNSW